MYKSVLEKQKEHNTHLMQGLKLPLMLLRLLTWPAYLPTQRGARMSHSIAQPSMAAVMNTEYTSGPVTPEVSDGCGSAMWCTDFSWPQGTDWHTAPTDTSMT